MLVSPLVARVTVFEAYTMFGFPAHLDVDVTLIAHLPTPPRSEALPRRLRQSGVEDPRVAQHSGSSGPEWPPRVRRPAG
jgi:hypothetical protein